MKTRVITAIIIILFVVGVILVDNRALGVVMFFLSLLATHEYIKCFEKTVYKPIKVISYMSTLVLLPLAIEKINISVMVMAFLLYFLVVLLALMAVLKNRKYSIIDLAITLFGILYIPFLFSFVTFTRLLQNGIYYIWIIFIGSCATDTFAYFIGILFGKNKLLPDVSPKKTIEGAIGGIVGTVIIMMLYGKYLINVGIIDVSLVHFVVLGFVTSVVSQIGDLFASSIKRFVGIKDYGSILPGHGGILDRFDSIMFIAPMIYFYIRILGGV